MPAIALRTIQANGTASTPTVLAAAADDPSMIFDGRHLVVVYAIGGVGYLEARNPSDRSLRFKQTLGAMAGPRISWNASTGEAVILYTHPTGSGTFARSLRLD